MRDLFDRATIAAPLALLAFWCGMLTAAHFYPGGYDWLYQTISVLLYPDQNPRGYLWAWAGVELCGVAGLTWTATLGRRSAAATTRRPSIGLRFLQLGFLCMCCTVLPAKFLPFVKGHEFFALLAFIGLCIGVTSELWIATGRRESWRSSEALARIRTPFRQLLPLLPLVPLVLAGATQAYLALERPELPWVTPQWRTLGISPWLSFGLWEWISGAVLSLGLLALWICRPPRVHRR